MLSNAYFLAKFRFDTAENEPAKNLQNFAKKNANFANPNPLMHRVSASPGAHGAALRPGPRQGGRDGGGAPLLGGFQSSIPTLPDFATFQFCMKLWRARSRLFLVRSEKSHSQSVPPP